MQPTLKLDLPRERNSAVIARRWLEEQLAEGVPPATLQDVKLVATELVNNAYLHGEGRIQLMLKPTADTVCIEVVDQGEGQAVKIREEPDGPGGQGLRLVEAISAEWGAFEGTTHVWARLRI